MHASLSLPLSALSPLPQLEAKTPHWVVCLCADWCGLCRDYRAVLEEVAHRFSGNRFVWLDIEDQADWVGDMDIETFPTLLVADTAGVLFFGSTGAAC